MMKKIEHLQIGPYKCRVRELDDALATSTSFGYFDPHTLEIRVNVEKAHTTNSLETLLHEGMHGVSYQVGHLGDNLEEEAFVSYMAPGLLLLLKDNPQLLDAINKYCKGTLRQVSVGD